MSKISAALSIDSSQKSDNCENTLKYGDDDVSSKRRKDAVDADEYNTVFTKRLSSSSALNQLNSTSHDVEADRSGACCSDDFTGGPVNENTSKVSTSAHSIEDLDEAFNVSITTLPSNSSFGFENTFNVLERQLSLSKQPKLNQQQIEYILMKSNDTAVKNPIYIDIPISDEWCLRAISGQANGSLQATTIDPINIDDGPPSLFDLEIEAMLRVKELLASTDRTSTDTVDAGSTRMAAAPVVVDVNAHIPINTSLIEDFYQQDGGDYSEYVYHVAKSKDGRVYLRVVRSLLVDKGKINQFSFVVCVPNKRLKIAEDNSEQKWATPIFQYCSSSRWHRFNRVI